MELFRKKIIILWKSQQGVASFVALAVMLLLAGLGGAMLSASSSEIRTTVAYRDGIAAQYAAEAGAKRAVVELNKNAGKWTGTTAPANFGAGTYSVSVSGPMLRRTVTSIGTVNGASRQVILDVVPDNAYRYVVYSGNSLDMGGIYINGSVRSNKDIKINALSYITGKAIAHTTVGYSFVGNILSYVKGGIVQQAPVLQIPIIGKDTTRAQYRDNANRKTANTSLAIWTDTSSLDSTRIYYYEGSDLSIFSTIKGPGVIYATGDVWIGSLWGLTGEISNNVIIIAEGTIHLVTANVQDTALVAGGDIVSVAGIFTGSAVANGSVSLPVNGMGKPSSNWSAPSNPYIPQPPAWTTDSIGVEKWGDAKSRQH